MKTLEKKKWESGAILARMPEKFLVVTVFLFALGGTAWAAPLSEGDIVRIWRNNGAVQGVQEFHFGVVDWPNRVVAVEGRGPVPWSTEPNARLLARRHAVADAQRRLLYLLYELRYGLPRGIDSIAVEGHVVMGHISQEGQDEQGYWVDVELPLQRFLEECVIWKARAK